MITIDRGLTREQFDQLTEQRRQLTARLTPEELTGLQQQRDEQVSRLTPERLAGSAGRGRGCSRPIPPSPGRARNEHPRTAVRPARHKVRHEARGSVEQP
jgi:hypothetical protein